jgi:hypothetical protein
MVALKYLQNDPNIDGNIAADEKGAHPRDVAVLVDEGQPVHPGLSARDPEQRDEGSVKSSKAARG